jgi:hypothetical protein
MKNPARVLALFLALTGCAEGASSGPQGQPPVRPDAAILELQSADKEPIGLLSYGGEDQPGELGTHCWTTRCVDFIGPPTPKTFTEVPGDVVIELEGDGRAESITLGQPPDEEFGQLVDEREIKVDGGRAQLDLTPGRYVLMVFATWSEGGDAVLTFGLDVRG